MGVDAFNVCSTLQGKEKTMEKVYAGLIGMLGIGCRSQPCEAGCVSPISCPHAFLTPKNY